MRIIGERNSSMECGPRPFQTGESTPGDLLRVLESENVRLAAELQQAYRIPHGVLSRSIGAGDGAGPKTRNGRVSSMTRDAGSACLWSALGPRRAG